MNKNIILPGLIFCTAFFYSSCRNKHESENDHVNFIRQSGDTVILGQKSHSLDKIVTMKVANREYAYSFTTTGVVRPLTGQLAQISAPFEGRIINSFVRLGEKIARGAPIFSIASPEYFEAVRSLQETTKEHETAIKNFNRKKELMDQGVVSKKDFEEATLSLDLARRDYEKACANVKIFNVNPENTDSLNPLIITSPISGEVVSDNITLGQYLKTDSDPVVVVANLEKVWVVAHVKEKDLGKIKAKAQVEIITEGLPDKTFTGTVEYIGNIMEDQTRSVEVFIECGNSEKLIKPGMFVTVHFRYTIENAILIPATALLQDDDRTFVFVRLSDSIFIRRTISVVSLENHQVLASSGLCNGDIIVSEGGIYLR